MTIIARYKIVKDKNSDTHILGENSLFCPYVRLGKGKRPLGVPYMVRSPYLRGKQPLICPYVRLGKGKTALRHPRHGQVRLGQVRLGQVYFISIFLSFSILYLAVIVMSLFLSFYIFVSRCYRHVAILVILHFVCRYSCYMSTFLSCRHFACVAVQCLVAVVLFYILTQHGF